MASSAQNALLGAEWSEGGPGERTTVFELTTDSAFVVTDKLPAVGAKVHLTMSFAGLVTAEVQGRVKQVRLSLDPGSPAGFATEFDDDHITRAAVTKLLRATRPRPGARRRSVRVLHVDGSRLLRDMFSYAVNKYFSTKTVGPELAQADDLASALRQIDEGGIHVVKVDHELRDGKGEEVARYARQRLGVTAWIVGVGLGGSAARQRMLTAGADIYLQKPIVLTDVLYSIELLMREEVRDALGAA